MDQPHEIALGLGSNLGDRVVTLVQAIRHLMAGAAPALIVKRISPLFESDAMLLEDSPPEWDIPFLNIVITGTSFLDPLALLEKVKQIEVALGRKASPRWAPREIDIDILTFDAMQLDSVVLKLPHPGMAKRSFVVEPFWAAHSEMATRIGLPKHAHDSVAVVKADAVLQKQFVSLLDRHSIIDRALSRAAVAQASSKIVGIINCTPDSFSDGGMISSPDIAISRARQMLDEGAEICDVGAESTRPHAEPISPVEEQARLFPIVSALLEFRAASDRTFLISVDTRNADTARGAVALGIDWLNDVSGFNSPSMIEVAAACEIPIVVMHNLGVPPSRDVTLDQSRSTIDQLLEWFGDTIERLQSAGIRRQRIILDPGIGFGKTANQSFEILRDCERLWALGQPLLIGHSRKSFLAAVTSVSSIDRDLETAVLSGALAQKGIEYLRVHNVGASARACSVIKKIVHSS